MKYTLGVFFFMLMYHEALCQNIAVQRSNQCSQDGDCEGQLICGTDNHCREPCRGQSYCCSTEMPGYCIEGEGPCDSDDQCQGSLVCGANACMFDNADDRFTSCCSQQCIQDDDCEGSLVCGTDNFCREPCEGDSYECSRKVPGYCKEGEGDCDSDHECNGSLVCGWNNCFYWNEMKIVDCCRQGHLY